MFPNLKKVLLLAMVLCLVFTMAGCRDSGTPATGTDLEASGSDGGKGFKVAIVTGTLQDGEEEYTMAQMLKEKYPDIVVTACYPDNYATETDTHIAVFTSLAADPDIKAIVCQQAVAGTAAAIDKVREMRDDIIFLCATCADAPDVISSKATICLHAAGADSFLATAKQAYELGAETLVFYSFPRHMSQALIAAGRKLVEEFCDEVGMKFVYVTSPDSQSEAGIYGVQQFIAEDVPRQIETYGKQTAFMGTNCHQQEPMIRAVLEGGAIFPCVCCKSPLHKYPSAMGIDMTGHSGDVEYAMEKIAEVVESYGMSGRVASWAMSPPSAMTAALTEYAIMYLEGKTNGKLDVDALAEAFNKAAGVSVQLSNLELDGRKYDNYFTFVSEFRVY